MGKGEFLVGVLGVKGWYFWILCYQLVRIYIVVSIAGLTGRGDIIIVGSIDCGKDTIFVAEVKGLREGVRAVMETGMKDLQIEGDNNIVIKVLFKE